MKRISKKILFLIVAILLVFSTNFNAKYYSDPIIKKWAPKNDVVEMPIVHNSKPVFVYHDSSSPNEQRDEKYINFLSASVKISANGASGSGTICYFDPKENWAYVISCGHLWEGNKAYSKSDSKNKAKITTWYHNEKKLDKPEIYDAEVLFWSNNRGYDCSCLRFKPNWKPNFFPIASLEYKIDKSQILNSLGCDGGSEVARYEVEFVEYRGLDLIAVRNSPRPGRSGGGLITDNGWYVGVCWGTSDTISGNGIGYFTPLKSIHEVFIKNGHEWLIILGEFSGRHIPIYDWENPKNKFKWDFIPVPTGVKSCYFFL